MKYSTIIFLFVLFFIFGCNRTTPSGQQTAPVLPPPTPEMTAVNNFDTSIFKGSGNEPFWSLQIDEDHTLILKFIDDHQLKINTPITDITSINDANALSLTAGTKDKKITIMLMESSCQDNMSGQKFSHGLQVVIKDRETNKSIFYKGCGKFINEYLVNNQWELESINDKSIADLLVERTPTLNINLLENKVNGFAGCNTFFGSVEIENGKLNFKNIGLTKKACKDNTTETLIVKLLNDNTQRHSITQDGKLVLKNAEQILTFKPTK